MGKTLIKIGPADHGRRMSLEDFDHAEVQEGYRYELSRGIITVSDIPNRLHFLQTGEINRQLYGYRLFEPAARLPLIAGAFDCKLPIADLESERHPDFTLYLSPSPEDDEDEDFWAQWIPEIVIEVVSPESRKCDYDEKPEEYLRFGLMEYWIVNSRQRALVVMRRTRGRWAQMIVKPPDLYRSRLLPNFEFSCGAVFEAAGLT